MLWISPQLDILCTSAAKRYYAEMTIHRLRVTCLFPAYPRSWKQKTCRRLLRTSFWLTSYSTEHCKKIVSSQFPRRWSSKARSVATLGPISQAAIKVALDQLLRRWWWCLGYTVDMLNFCWPNHVYNQRWLAILRQLCTIIERFA